MVSLLIHKNILFIVEGEDTEPKLLKKIYKYMLVDEYEVYSYKTCIYELYEELDRDEYLDILQLLKEKTTSDHDRRILSRKYAAIYLIFDFEPLYHRYDFEKIKNMIKFFNESSENGRLYINYPAVESHRHLRMMPDNSFLELKVNETQIRRYKHFVSLNSDYTDLNSYTYDIVLEMIAHHFIKYNYILYGDNRMSTIDQFRMLSYKEDIKIAEIQDALFKSEDNSVLVLNTSLFYIIDLKPESFFKSRVKSLRL